MIPIILAVPGISDGLVRVDPEDDGSRVVGARITCAVCDEMVHVTAGRPGQLLPVSLQHGDGCPMVDLQVALDRGDTRGVRHHRRRALALLRRKREAVLS